MGIKKYKPKTPSLRWTVGSDFNEITKSRPVKSLVYSKKSSGGRNSYGRITSRHRGGGHKRKIRMVDFKRDKFDVPARISAIEYDPNRSARLALLEYIDGDKRYIIAPLGLKVNDTVVSGKNTEIKVGNATQLRNIPPGTPIYNIELKEGRGGQLVRSAGDSGLIMAKEEPYAHVKLPSGEVRLIKLNCLATIGQVGNVEHDTLMIGKAGRSRHMGIRPCTRGVAKNPHDHPMGGGEGKASGGRHPTTPWGKPTKGFKTRKTKQSDKYILRRRK
ncbi:MAG: 50S ribosomal protein L2 [Candidatus Omnitrophica bacterium]|nr:50S ribosomal protein L2 [Candidatus Omnitrophota bacterium]